MTWGQLKELRRASLGVVVALWVILLAYAALHAAAAGPQWGFGLGVDTAGRVVATEVATSGAAYPRIDNDYEIVAVDGADPHQFLTASLAGVHEVSYRDAS